MLSLLRAAGAKFRSEDPVGMKRFVLDLQRRVADARERECDARASEAPEEDGGKDGGAKNEEGDENKNKKSVGGSSLTRRAGLMLDMVVDLNNNKRTAGAGPGGEAAADVDQWGFPNALSRWLPRAPPSGHRRRAPDARFENFAPRGSDDSGRRRGGGGRSWSCGRCGCPRRRGRTRGSSRAGRGARGARAASAASERGIGRAVGEGSRSA